MARGWYYLGGQNGIPSIPPMSLGSYDIIEGPVYYYLVLGILVAGLSVVPLPGAIAIRSGAGRACARTSSASPSSAIRCNGSRRSSFRSAGAIARLAGSLYAFHEGFVWPNMLGVVMSTQVVLTYCSAAPAR